MPSPDGYVGEAATIRGWFEGEWPSGTPIQLIEGSPFTERPDDAAWARLRIRNTDGGPATVGGPLRRYRYWGDIIVEIKAPAHVGDGALRELADQALDIIRDREDGGITVWRVRALPLSPEDGWNRMNVLGSFTRDQTHTTD